MADLMTESLTTAQQDAVIHEDGPLIVLAGPGTGKTRTITHRIAHIVRERGIEPESVVALTFTVKAAAQLRERLAGLVGPLLADRVNVSTIHGFGNRLLQRFGDMLGLPPELQLIDGAQSHRLLKEVIVTHGLFTSSRGEGLRRLMQDLGQVFAGIANRGLSQHQCAGFVHDWSVRLERAPRDQMTELEYEAQLAEHAHFADAVLAMNFFAQARWQRGWLSYDDYLTLPLRLLREQPAALAICRGDYRAFVVDEFQDCNPGQIELLRLLAPPESNPDVCVVGDDDQAIYRFRGADERAFGRFAALWTRHTVIELGENYRSQPPLIEVANAVIRKAQSRFRPDKTIKFASAKAPLPDGACTIEAIRLEEEFQDGAVIAAMIDADRAAAAVTGASRPWRDYAVIARTHGDLDRVAASLAVHGIPFERTRERSHMEDAGVMDVLAWVEWLVDSDATWAARRVLTRPPYGVDPGTAAGWEIEFGAQKSHYSAGRSGVKPPPRFDLWLRDKAESEPGAAPALELYERLLQEIAPLRADEAVFHIITAIDAAHGELLPARARAQRVSALIALLGLVREKQSRLSPPSDLRAFWYYLQELMAAGDPLLPAQDLDLVPDPPAGLGEEGEGAVQLLTAHSSKGLEFDTVFIPRVKAPYGYPNSRGDDCWEPPQGLFDNLDPRSEAERRCDEERRLFYVACTRAERRLVLFCKPNKTVTKTVNYFDELTRAGTLPVVVQDAAKVLALAQARGMSIVTGLEAAAVGVQQVSSARADRLRSQARLQASQALAEADDPGATPEALASAARRFQDAAERIAVIAGAERGTPPEWLLAKRPELTKMAEGLARLNGQHSDGDDTPESLLIRPMSEPLRLSYSAIYEYHQCARCFYLSRVLDLPQPYSPVASVGTVAHAVLKQFYDRWAKADSEGRPKPGVEQLVAMAREGYLASLSSREAVDVEALEQISAQMRLLFERLHRDDAQVLETERAIQFDYPLDGHTHSFIAKLDRIDLLPDGGVRVIDYKTGYASQRLLAPKKDDLQLGIYALALRLSKDHSFGEGPLRGVAEYWCLSTGERGCIALSELDEGKIRATIDEAARGMVSGHFPKAKDCTGPCTLFQ